MIGLGGMVGTLSFDVVRSFGGIAFVILCVFLQVSSAMDVKVTSCIRFMGKFGTTNMFGTLWWGRCDPVCMAER